MNQLWPKLKKAVQKLGKESLLSLLLLAAAFAVSLAAVPVQGIVTTFGTACVASQASISCPSTPPTFTGEVGTQLTISINIAGLSQPYNAFDIRVLTNSSFLNPVSVNLTGGQLPAVSLIAECINGKGTGCNSTLDVSGVVRVAINATGTSAQGGNGHLFSITYKIVGSTTGTKINYQYGCSPHNVCILVTDTPPCGFECVSDLPVGPQGATFSNPPTFKLSASPASLTILKPASASTTITVTSINGFSGTITLSATISPSVKHGPALSLSATVVSITPGSTSTSTLSVGTIGSTPVGTYGITVVGTGGAQSVSLQVPVSVTK